MKGAPEPLSGFVHLEATVGEGRPVQRARTYSVTGYIGYLEDGRIFWCPAGGAAWEEVT